MPGRARPSEELVDAQVHNGLADDLEFRSASRTVLWEARIVADLMWDATLPEDSLLLSTMAH